MKPQFVFGYGSLLSLASTNRTLSTPVSDAAVKEATLRGYVRTWTYFDHVVFEGEEHLPPTLAAFLSLRPAQNVQCAGVLIPIDDDDLRTMDARERLYDRRDVTTSISPHATGTVFTYVERRSAPQRREPAVVPTRYESLIDDALDRWGTAFRAAFERSTVPHSFPRKAGRYKFANPGQQAALEVDRTDA